MRKFYKKYLIFILLFFIVLLVICFFKNKNIRYEEITLNFESRVIKLEELDEASINKYGWLQVQGTKVDVPILLTVNTMDTYSYGWISSNSVGMKTRKVLVGHNVLNVSSSPLVNEEVLTDFEDLMAFSYYDFAKENMYISFTENGIDKIFVIYAIGFYDYDYDNASGLNEKDDIKKYINDVKKNSIYKYDVSVNENDNILTVKTCTRYFGDSEKQQFIIDARELRENEKTFKYNVKKTDLYKKYGLKDVYKKNDEI